MGSPRRGPCGATMSAFESTDFAIRPAKDLVFLLHFRGRPSTNNPLSEQSVISDNDDFCLGVYFVFGSSRQRPFFPPWPPTLKNRPDRGPRMQQYRTAVRELLPVPASSFGPDRNLGLASAWLRLLKGRCPVLPSIQQYRRVLRTARTHPILDTAFLFPFLGA